MYLAIAHALQNEQQILFPLVPKQRYCKAEFRSAACTILSSPLFPLRCYGLILQVSLMALQESSSMTEKAVTTNGEKE